MDKPAQPRRAKLIGGLVFATALFLMGLVLAGPRPLAAHPSGATDLGGRPLRLCLTVTTIAGSLFVFMVLVADVLCPDTPMVFTCSLKFVAAVTAWGGLLAVTLLWGRAVFV